MLRQKGMEFLESGRPGTVGGEGGRRPRRRGYGARGRPRFQTRPASWPMT